MNSDTGELFVKEAYYDVKNLPRLTRLSTRVVLAMAMEARPNTTTIIALIVQ